MAEYRVYKNSYQNQITSLFEKKVPGWGDWSANEAQPISKVTVKYWGTFLGGALSYMGNSDYIDRDDLQSGYSLPGTEKSMQSVGWAGSTPFPVMKNSNGLFAYFPICVKFKKDSFSTFPALFVFKNGRWTYNKNGDLNIYNPMWQGWEDGGTPESPETVSAANDRYNTAINGSSLGFLYNEDYNRIEIYIIYSGRQYIYKNSVDDSLSSLNGWTRADVVGPDDPGDTPPPDPVNPYQPGNPSGEGTLPPGTFDETSDAIPDSPLPTLSAANTGFTRIYNPTLSQVQDLARYLWTDETVIQTIWNHIKQYFEDPMQAIIGFNLVPCAVPDAGSQSFALMYIDTGVQMNVAANQFVDVDCGSVKLERFYGSALDQSPYTRVSCFLPFIGTVKLNTDEVMETTLQVKYRIDICSGSCVAKILVDGNVIYQYSGHCAINIPISSADFSSYVQATMSIAKLAVGAAVGGAMGALAAASTEPSQQTNRAVTTTRTETNTERNPTTGRQVTSGTSTVTTTEETHSETSTKASFDYLTPSNIANTVGQVMGAKPIVEHTGSFSGNSGYLGVRRPFLIIERPNMCLPEQYQRFNGYPSMITMQLSTCNGFTKVQQVQLTGMSATNPEQGEILGLLKSGVIF